MEENAPPTTKPTRRPFVLADLMRAVGLLFLVWAAIEVVFFWRTNKALWHQGEEAPFGVFSHLFTSDWSFSLTNTPPLVFFASMFLMTITTFLGVVILRLFDVRVRTRLQIALGFAIGFGVSGIAFELLTMARLLYTSTAWVMWILLYGLFGGLAFWRYRRPVLRWWRKPAEGDERLIPFLDVKGKRARDFITINVPRNEELFKTGKLERIFWWVALVFSILISAAIFWHAIFFPEAYWDSLILYLGYARMTFLEHGFPFKATAQVGIGLGANYPHLFSNYGAMASTMFGSWSDLYQRMAAPVAGMLSVIAVYDIALLVWGRRGVAIAAALLFRTVPLGIAYSTYASDYAFAILFTATFLYFAALFARTRLPGVFALFTLMPAVAMHLNYLMGILWLPWLAAVLISIMKRRRVEIESIDEETDLALFPRKFAPEAEEGEAGEPLELELQAADHPGFRPVLLSRFFWITIVVCIALGSTWYVRNWVLTGNPVYAFFPSLFPRSVQVNPEVLASADIEWFLNGDGIGRVAETIVEFETGMPSPESPEEFERRATLEHRLKASWLFWQGFEPFRFVDGDVIRGSWIDRLQGLFVYSQQSPGEEISSITGDPIRYMGWHHYYKMSPLVMGFVLPGFMLGMLVLLFPKISAFATSQPVDIRVFNVVWYTSCLLVFALLAYHYLLADYYLYQIIPIIVPMAIIGCVPFVFWRSEESRLEKLLEVAGYLLILSVAIVPGFAMSLMNFKAPRPAVVYGKSYNPLELDIFRHPGMPPDTFYRTMYADDVGIWGYVNQMAIGQSLLTHENRHLMFDPTIEIVHLDDWDIQKTYTMESANEKMRLFRQRGIDYYLRVPNEFRHPITQRVGLDELIEKGYLEAVVQDGENTLYRFQYNELP